MKLAALLEIAIKYLKFEFNYHQIGILKYIKFPNKKICVQLFHDMKHKFYNGFANSPNMCI
jgi:hypothetical protein